MSGLQVSVNELGFTVIRLHYSADPSKNVLSSDPIQAEQAAKWLEETRQTYPNPNQWAQEMELNWWIAAGRRVYPEFSESVHVRPSSHRPRKSIYRAWDFGWLAPACLVGQLDEQDRLILLREVVGKEETTKQFANRVIERCATWYPDHSAGFQDVCDPAGQQRSATSESSEVRDIEVLHAVGIYPRWEYGWTRRDGRSLVHQLLALRTDSTPGLYVDGAQCPTLVQGFLGKYVYPGKRGGTAHDEPDESNHPWADVHACLRYLCTGLYTALGLRRDRKPPSPPRKVTWHGYGTPAGQHLRTTEAR